MTFSSYTLQRQRELNALGAGLKEDGLYGPKTLAADQKYGNQLTAQYLQSHPNAGQFLNNGNTVDSILNAFETGNYDGITDARGMPLNKQMADEALKSSTDDLEGYRKAEQTKDTADTEDALRQKQADYAEYLRGSQENFQKEKTQQDQTAANQGVLFSGGRVQKLNNLKTNYEADQSYRKGSYGRDIAGTARDFEYNYGTPAAKNLSSMYKLGGNTYNPNVATGGVGQSGLSKMYQTGQGDYQGTQINKYKAAATTRAAGKLWNQANKIVPLNYNNQYN